MTATANQTLYLIDASIYVFRAWYSVPDGFTDSQGRPTNAVYGFATFICELLENTDAQHIAIAFDESLSTSFRNEIYPEYKANRDPAPQELRDQFAWCRQVAEAMGIACYSDGRFEADDLIGSLASHAQQQGQVVGIVSADKDLTQLLQNNDYLWDYARGVRLKRADVHKRFGVYPEQIADYLALTGDAVDNIKGVPGIGPKTAANLLHYFSSLDELWQRLDEVGHLSMRGAKGIQTRLRDNIAAAQLARELTGIRLDALPADTCVIRNAGDAVQLDSVFDALGFGRLLRKRCAAQLT